MNKHWDFISDWLVLACRLRGGEGASDRSRGKGGQNVRDRPLFCVYAIVDVEVDVYVV